MNKKYNLNLEISLKSKKNKKTLEAPLRTVSSRTRKYTDFYVLWKIEEMVNNWIWTKSSELWFKRNNPEKIK